MRVIVTAGPTRQYIDSVRFISNASSGLMGLAVASAAVRAGHEVTLIAADSVATSDDQWQLVRFVGVADLAEALDKRFDACDALVMVAAVGDFQPRQTEPGKIRRGDGPISIELVPVQDILAGLGRRKRPGQTVVAFAVEGGRPEEIEAAALDKLTRKGADFIVANTTAAMATDSSRACILSAAGVVLPWADRPKAALAGEIVALLSRGDR